MDRNRYILTPYFLDKELPQLKQIARKDWHINEQHFDEDNQMVFMSNLHRTLAGLVTEAIRSGERPISIAGDCCTAIGVLAGLQGVNLAPSLIWFDAHGDFNTWETTPSGFLGGMPLAMIVGRGEQTLVDAVDLRNLPEEKVVLTDGRSLDPGESELIKNSGIHHITDVAALMEMTLPEGPLWIHFDTDVVNPTDVPAVSYPAAGGRRAEELEDVFRYLASTDRIVAVSMSVWNLELDENHRSEQVCMKLLDVL